MTTKAYAQRWTEYERGWGSRPDGFTLYLTKESHAAHIERDKQARLDAEGVPDEYSVPEGTVHEVHISDALVQKLVHNEATTGRPYLWFGPSTKFDSLATYKP